MEHMKAGYITDEEFGRVQVSVNARAKRVTLTAKDDGLYVTVAPGVTEAAIRQVLDRNRESLRGMMARAKSKVRFLDFNYEIHTDMLHLRILPSAEGAAHVKRSRGVCNIYLQPETPFDNIQEWLSRIVIQELRVQAQMILPARLQELAAAHHFRYNGVTIRRSRTNWGSCSHEDHINLSLYLMTVPARLADYVLLHELCHTRHKDHSPAFWALMDQVTNGKAKALRKQLTVYSARL